MTTNNDSEEEEKKSEITIDLNEIYKFEPEDLEIDIENETYSNLAYIQVAHRDLQIDFLKMPGTKEGDKQKVKGTRIHMSHAAAQKMAEKLLGILEKSYEEEPFEEYEKK